MTVSPEKENDEILGKEISIDERRFVVENVHDGKASLRDLTFEGSMGFPISRVENIDTVRRLLAEQEPPKQDEPVKLRSVVIDLTAPAQEETPAKKKNCPPRRLFAGKRFRPLCCTLKSPAVSAITSVLPTTIWARAAQRPNSKQCRRHPHFAGN